MTRFHRSAAQRADQVEEPPRLASWYTPGLSDAVGDRLLMFDNTTASALELLRFRPEFGAAPGFEEALRAQVAALADFTHRSVARVRSVEALGDGDGIALVSNHVEGRRLSEILLDARGPQFATELLRQLVPVLAALQERGAGIAHGLITPERVVVTPEGQLVLVEHVLGAAFEALHLPADRLRAEFGLAIPPAARDVHLDQRADVVQLGYLALSLLAGERVRSASTAGDVFGLLDRQARMPGREAPGYLQRWLLRALQVDARSFGSAGEAAEALGDWPDRELDGEPGEPGLRIPARISARETSPATAAPSVAEVQRPLAVEIDDVPEAVLEPPVAPMPAPAPSPATASPPAPVPSPTHAHEDEAPEPAPAAATASPAPPAPAAIPAIEEVRPTDRPAAVDFRARVVEPARPAAAEERQSAIVASRPFSILAEAPEVSAPPAAPFEDRTVRLAIAALAIAAVLEGLVIVGLLYRQAPAADTAGGVPPTTVAEVAATPAPVDVSPANSTTRTAPAASPARTTTQAPATPERVTVPDGRAGAPVGAPPAPAQPSDGLLAIDTPLDLEIYDGALHIGTTRTGPIALAPGSRTLRLSSQALAYETTLAVEIAAGRTFTATVPAPNGLLSLNAFPWANVTIDGREAGRTPIANFAVPVGPHEIVWRHPDLGERRQTVVVTARMPARLVIDLRE